MSVAARCAASFSSFDAPSSSATTYSPVLADPIRSLHGGCDRVAETPGTDNSQVVHLHSDDWGDDAPPVRAASSFTQTRGTHQFIRSELLAGVPRGERRNAAVQRRARTFTVDHVESQFHAPPQSSSFGQSRVHAQCLQPSCQHQTPLLCACPDRNHSQHPQVLNAHMQQAEVHHHHHHHHHHHRFRSFKLGRASPVAMTGSAPARDHARVEEDQTSGDNHHDDNVSSHLTRFPSFNVSALAHRRAKRAAETPVMVANGDEGSSRPTRIPSFRASAFTLRVAQSAPDIPAARPTETYVPAQAPTRIAKPSMFVRATRAFRALRPSVSHVPVSVTRSPSGVTRLPSTTTTSPSAATCAAPLAASSPISEAPRLPLSCIISPINLISTCPGDESTTPSPTRSRASNRNSRESAPCVETNGAPPVSLTENTEVHEICGRQKLNIPELSSLSSSNSSVDQLPRSSFHRDRVSCERYSLCDEYWREETDDISVDSCEESDLLTGDVQGVEETLDSGPVSESNSSPRVSHEHIHSVLSRIRAIEMVERTPVGVPAMDCDNWPLVSRSSDDTSTRSCLSSGVDNLTSAEALKEPVSPRRDESLLHRDSFDKNAQSTPAVFETVSEDPDLHIVGTNILTAIPDLASFTSGVVIPANYVVQRPRQPAFVSRPQLMVPPPVSHMSRQNNMRDNIKAEAYSVAHKTGLCVEGGLHLPEESSGNIFRFVSHYQPVSRIAADAPTSKFKRQASHNVATPSSPARNRIFARFRLSPTPYSIV
jgi:hypothetical protein